MNSQEKIILNDLKNKKSVTQLEVTEKYQILRLSAIIYNLRKKGYNIMTQNKKSARKHGKYAKYVLIEGE